MSLADIERADAIFVIGQNPGTNHPRMLTTLAAAKRRGARIVAINPLRERGLVRFAHPQDPLALLGRGTAIADLYLQVRVGGDVALLKGIMKAVLEAEARAPGRVLDWPFLREHTAGLRGAARRSGGAALATSSRRAAASRAQRHARGRGHLLRSGRRRRLLGDGDHAAPTRRRQRAGDPEPAAAAREHRRPGAGPCPVRGHSNVQGDRTVGITERPAAGVPRAAREPSSASRRRRRPGLDTVAAIGALRDGGVRVFLALGGNFAVATPDARATAAALGALPARGADRDHAEPHAAARRARSARAARASRAASATSRRAASSS